MWDRCYNRNPRGLPLHIWNILISFWSELYHIQISDTAYWIWIIWTVSNAVKTHADGTRNNWKDESNQKGIYFDFLSGCKTLHMYCTLMANWWQISSSVSSDKSSLW
jgi:hypothetical protein